VKVQVLGDELVGLVAVPAGIGRAGTFLGHRARSQAVTAEGLRASRMYSLGL
jgi:hypothetical protein